MGEPAVRDAFAKQAEWCDRLGSPFTARLMAVLATHIDRSTATGRRVLDWPCPPDALGDAVPLRLAGAFHGLGRSGRLPALAKLYPPHPAPEPDRFRDMVVAALNEADDDINAWLDHPPQTNEVARSAVLYPGLMTIARETGLPLALYEIGASAGLNLIPDSYAYRLGGKDFGSSRSPVRLAPEWNGPAPAGPEPRIAGRRGCDLNPLDVSDMAQCERLIAYVWPDQAKRLSRIEEALRLARHDPPPVDEAEAGGWTDRLMQEEPVSGVARVVFHSIAIQYFPEEAQRLIAGSLRAAGQRATSDAPLAWLAFEVAGAGGPRLTLTLWPGGGERILAHADAHVRAVEWLGR